MWVGASVKRIDAIDKVTGRAQYTADFPLHGAMVARVLHATIANGKVLRFDLREALQVPGLVKIVTCFDAPDFCFDTGTHPWSTDPARQGIEDRKILNTRVRYYGDDIAAVVATHELAAREALQRIHVEYEEYPPVLDVFAAIKPGAVAVNADFPDNILAHSTFSQGNYATAIQEPDLTIVEGWYETPSVKHCQMEPASSFAYLENGVMVVYSSTQTPHSLRRVIGQAIGLPWGRVRIVKPCVGGGFGNKEDALYEPLNAFLSMQVGGKCVKLILTREEDFANTRVRHAIKFHLISHVRRDGSIAARKMIAYSNKGAYCHHGHAIVCKSASVFQMLYPSGAMVGELYTVLTNTPCAGAMRGYGAPQGVFAVEAHAEDIAKALNMDSVAFRMKNLMPVGYKNESEHLENYFDSLRQCLARGADCFRYQEKKRQYQNQTGSVRRGIGVSAFWYNTGAYPHLLEACTCRMVLNQDGSVQVQLPEVEIGQGADTVFSQMAADVLQLPLERIHLVCTQDTDTVGSGSGAYASRQTYIGGAAIYRSGSLLKEKILIHAAAMCHCSAAKLQLKQAAIYSGTEQKYSLAEVALHAYYNPDEAVILQAELTTELKTNALSLGCCYAEVEVDLPTGKITVLDILNVHDCGRLINPKLSQAQVQGGISMGIGYALSEELLFDTNTGKLHNPTMLDYKVPTAMDHPSILRAEFIQNPEPTNPFGVKALGEPPVVPVAPAIRNAVLQATGVAFHKLPLSPQTCWLRFREEGLI